ncbi:response regulator transcription factor [uncultured Litoreibacter sp.]|uniref:response regulator transcription factor n=1 Tax=uncultured Litoreibacter sp. TaxID=1392394 RepID=UPI002614AC88|nr:response regulator transcription factor [uncultured Litoreibacter sp.]
MRLLISEDDQLHRSFIVEVSRGVLPDIEELVETDNGQTALDQFQKNPFDCVVLDLQMPHMTGVDVAKAIWARHPQTRVLFWSNYSDEAYIRGITRIVPEEAVYGYILKSAPEDRLKLAIQGVFLADQCVIDREVRGVQQRSADRVSSLTDVEFEALVDVSLGLTDKAMAARRRVSLRGAQSRLQHLYQKLGLDKSDAHVGPWGPTVNSRTRVISVAMSRGLLNADTLQQEEARLQKWLTSEEASS